MASGDFATGVVPSLTLAYVASSACIVYDEHRDEPLVVHSHGVVHQRCQPTPPTSTRSWMPLHAQLCGPLKQPRWPFILHPKRVLLMRVGTCHAPPVSDDVAASPVIAMPTTPAMAGRTLHCPEVLETDVYTWNHRRQDAIGGFINNLRSGAIPHCSRLLASHLVAMENSWPGIRPIAIGDVFWRLSNICTFLIEYCRPS